MALGHSKRSSIERYGWDYWSQLTYCVCGVFGVSRNTILTAISEGENGSPAAATMTSAGGSALRAVPGMLETTRP